MVIKNPAPYKNLQRSFTRHSRVKAKAYIKTLPPQAVVKFIMGNSQKYKANEYGFKVEILSKQDAQVRDVALEAARTMLNRELEASIGTDYFMAVSVFPHQVLREHKQAAVAQADRMSQGMSLSFGKCVGRAAQVHKGKALITLAFNTESDIAQFRGVYAKMKNKFPCTSSLLVTPMKKN